MVLVYIAAVHLERICTQHTHNLSQSFRKVTTRNPANASLLLPSLCLQASQPVLDGIQDHVSVLHFVLHVTNLVVHVLGSLVRTRLQLPICPLQQARQEDNIAGERIFT